MSGAFGRAQSGNLFRSLGVDDGRVGALQILSDANHMALAVGHLPFSEELHELGCAVHSLHFIKRKIEARTVGMILKNSVRKMQGTGNMF